MLWGSNVGVAFGVLVFSHGTANSISFPTLRKYTIEGKLYGFQEC